MIKFTIPITPEPQRRCKVVSRGRFAGLAKTDKQVLSEHSILSIIIAHRPATPLAGPVFLRLLKVFPIPASWSKKKKAEMKGQWHTITPDSSNCLKNIEDCMQRVGFFGNDSQIAKHDLEKIYDDGHGPRWEVTLEELKCRI